ncbi:hypothetical protein [Yinghuangia soli]|uniref:Uncharacterized protein n=1 Tax=Yinghuangia soli TaxID=2908204 RepID=A0AA41Q309_9ACTN|nr:hypothetical protein [Yinghuangia soli]MCF2530045.1 hypothetical protein [Yinghuangia soli]
MPTRFRRAVTAAALVCAAFGTVAVLGVATPKAPEAPDRPATSGADAR